jgi:hypothetical protein
MTSLVRNEEVLDYAAISTIRISNLIGCNRQVAHPRNQSHMRKAGTRNPGLRPFSCK